MQLDFTSELCIHYTVNFLSAATEVARFGKTAGIAD